jgi:D-xylose transport system substrate-binding protein
MRNKVMAVLVAAVLAMSATGCGQKQSSVETGTENTAADNKVQIGITFDSFLIERWERDRDIFVSSAKDLGAEVNVQNANGDVEDQKKQIDYFIKKKMDVIVVIPVDSSSLTDEVRKAKNAGIKVIAYDRMLNNSDADLYISFDNETVGKFMADAIIKAMPDGGSIIKINGPSKDNNVSLVNHGFDKEIIHHNIKVLSTYYASEWDGEEAFNYMSAHSKEAAAADAVMCGNDSLAGQVVRYLSEQRLAGKVTVVGQDADLDACQRIVEGTQTMTVYKPIEKLAKKAAECAVALAGGNDIPGETVISDGKYSVPYVCIEPVAVDKDNIDNVIIDSGFHLREDVYLK